MRLLACFDIDRAVQALELQLVALLRVASLELVLVVLYTVVQVGSEL